MPVEVPNPIRFDQDVTHSRYDPEYAHRFWRLLVTLDTIFKEFRARFIGKVSPVHFFWGSFDLAVTRFSGRPAPERQGADKITRDAYSHEEISAGWWPGGGGVEDAAFYAYAAPEPAGFRERTVRPAKAYYHAELREFILPYEDVRNAADPKAALMEFLETTYEAGADLGHWDRAGTREALASRLLYSPAPKMRAMGLAGPSDLVGFKRFGDRGFGNQFGRQKRAHRIFQFGGGRRMLGIIENLYFVSEAIERARYVVQTLGQPAATMRAFCTLTPGSMIPKTPSEK